MKEIIDDMINDLENTKNNISAVLENHYCGVFILSIERAKEFIVVRRLITQDIAALSNIQHPFTGSLYNMLTCMPIIDKAIMSRAAN